MIEADSSVGAWRAWPEKGSRRRKLAKMSCTCDNLRAIPRSLIGTCADCGTQFRAHNSRQRRCHRCFLDLRERHEAEARQYAYDAAWDSAYRSGRLSVMSEELLHDLIQLCHPDRHNGRVDLATRVTRQLLELRENTRRPA